jgi:hypothetical protein
MRRTLGIVALCALAFGLGVWVMRLKSAPARPLPDGPLVIARIREVARLETLDLSLYKKIAFSPDPREGDSLWGSVVSWAKSTLLPREGKAIVFADVHVGLSLEALDANHLQLSGTTARVVLPPLQTRVELRPGETEFLHSNLDSAQTAQLLELAKEAFAREVEGDARLQEKARASARRAIGGLLYGLGFRKVEFVERLPANLSN